MTISQEDQKKLAIMNNLTVRAGTHGVIFTNGEPILSIIEKLVTRMDQYRDEPERKGRIPVD